MGLVAAWQIKLMVEQTYHFLIGVACSEQSRSFSASDDRRLFQWASMCTIICWDSTIGVRAGISPESHFLSCATFPRKKENGSLFLLRKWHRCLAEWLYERDPSISQPRSIANDGSEEDEEHEELGRRDVYKHLSQPLEERSERWQAHRTIAIPRTLLLVVVSLASRVLAVNLAVW